MTELRNMKAGYGNGMSIVGKNRPSSKQLQKKFDTIKEVTPLIQ